MQKNAYLEDLLQRGESDWASLNGGEKSLARMYSFTQQEEFPVLVSGRSESVQEADAETFVAAIKAAGIRQFFVISDFSNQLYRWLALDAAGLKLCGICELRTYKHGSLDEKIPALRFELQGEHKDGICPFCGAEIEYNGDQEIYDDSNTCVSWHCPECGASGESYYEGVFAGHGALHKGQTHIKGGN